MTVHEANSSHISNWMASGFQNFSENSSSFEDEDYFDEQTDVFSSLPGLKAIFYAIYITIFFIGICGNVFVCYVVIRNKSMHTVTNFFITNLALSHLLLCIFALPFIPLYLFMNKWIFGRVLCHLVPYAQGVSVYISAFTLMSIAIDTFIVIIYPFKPRLQLTYCYLIIVAIWVSAGLLTLLYGIFMALVPTDDGHYCYEVWPHASSRRAFMILTLILQFVVSFGIIIFCYLKVCLRPKNYDPPMPTEGALENEEMERERTRPIGKMFITMVIVFGASWLPINIYSLIYEFYQPSWKYLTVIYFFSDAFAMSSTCFNPFLYAWLNYNFRKEFMIVLLCFKPSSQATNTRTELEKMCKVTNLAMDTEM